MKKKIPVGATIAHAYRFAFGNFVTVLRSIWLPLAVQLGLSVLLTQHAIPLFRALESKDPSASSLLGPMVLLYPVVLILFFAQMATVTKISLGLQREIPLIDFPFGKDTWRLLGGFIVAGLAIFAIVMGFAIIGGIVGFLLRTLGVGKDMLTILVALLVIVAYGVVIFLVFRFLFLLAPVNIAEQRLGVGRAWQLSRRNFWRSLLVVLAIVLPFIIIEYAAIFASAGLPPSPFGLTAEAAQAARLEWNIAVMQAMVTNWYIVLPVGAVVMVLYLGAGCAAQCFAYRALTEEEGSTTAGAD